MIQRQQNALIEEDSPTAPSRPHSAAVAQALAPRPDWAQIGETEHSVQFYENDRFLVELVSDYAASALVAGDCAVLIARGEICAAVEEELLSRGLEIKGPKSHHRLVLLDARQTMSGFIVDESPEPRLFEREIGAVIDRAAASGRRVRAFGEMVALLWQDGNRQAAIKLESLWNRLATARSFSLLCAYPMAGFDSEADLGLINEICTCHQRIAPAESYTAMENDDQRLRAIITLQQKAHMLEAEVAQRRKAEQELFQRQKELADFFENATEGLHKVGADGTVIWANKAELEMLGYEASEYIGHSIAEFHADRDALDEMLARLQRGESLYNFPARLLCKDGQIRHVLVNSSAHFENGQFAHTRCFTRDITEQWHAQQRLLEAKAAAEKANQAKDQFLAVVSHELRTPLTPVLLAIGKMESEPNLPPALHRDLAMIRRNIAMETRIIDDLLDLSRVANGKMALHRQEVDIHALIRNVVEMVAADAKANSLLIETDLLARNARANADSARLHQALWNLLKNAIKFTPADGRITIQTRDIAPGRLAITVRDTGIGIAPRSLPLIFNAFDQGDQGASRQFGGLGLGLAITKAIVEMHDGTITAQSDGPGQGACFTIELPATPADIPLAQQQPPPDGCLPEPSSLRILLVDDHEDTLRVLRRLLEMSDHRVTQASSVLDAIRAADSQPFDILISDIGLPDGTGCDVARQVRLRHPGLPAIALTGFGMEQDIQNSGEAGFSAHLTKPVDMDLLEHTIKKLTARP